MAYTRKGLDPKLAKIASNLPKVAKQLGFTARVTSGFRTHKQQQDLYDAWRQGRSPYPAARPGTSDHEIGKAIDVLSTDEGALVALLTEAGLFWAGASDPIHFSMIGPNSRLAVARGESKKYAMPGKDEMEFITGTGKFSLDFGLKFFSKIFKGIF